MEAEGSVLERECEQMAPSKVQRFARTGSLLGVAALAVGCYVAQPVQVPSQPAPVAYQEPAPATTSYVPQYYEGNVVYFDASGLPFYYVNGVATYVPRSCTCYEVYVSHYRTYQAAYRQWYVTEGARMISVGLNLGF